VLAFHSGYRESRRYAILEYYPELSLDVVGEAVLCFFTGETSIELFLASPLLWLADSTRKRAKYIKGFNINVGMYLGINKTKQENPF